MFKRFTDRAAKTMALAKQEALHFHHEYIGTEHVLLALMKGGSGVAATALRNLGLNLPKLYAEVEQLAKSGSDKSFRGKLPQTAHAKEVIEHAFEEARILNHDYMGTAHLLLGLLRDSDGITAQVLMNLGLKLEDVRQEVLNLQAAGVEDEPLE